MVARQLAAQTVPTAGGNVVSSDKIGAASGVASLGTDSKVPQAQIPTPKITVGITAPSSPAVGDVWIDTN
ncbi:hypothetical protein DMB38_20260 [Streptomyces sp. WAC 06738]|uniref:hypothetical protein n=1 Tax=Streptomyces sp. WAC 06738 TaxID=2203210 RepID=UPI000F6C2115|nr:hypothetical protein [Streptomyces sp. WAC 06738]AZM47810.1 hypothetical protein DMB38_20260 [Streptomyces sp. WAC 06738]